MKGGRATEHDTQTLSKHSLQFLLEFAYAMKYIL